MKPLSSIQHVVEVVQRQVGEKWRQRRALRDALIARALQELLDHREHLAVADPPRHLREHPVVPNGVEVARQIDVDDAVSAAAQSRSHLLDRLVRRTSRTRSKGAVREVGFEDRFQDQPEGALHHAVSNRGNRDHADLAALLGNLSSSIRPGAVRAGAQLRGEFPEELATAACLDLLERLAVGPRGAVVALRLQVRGFERVELHDVDMQSPEAMRQGRISPDGLSSLEAPAD